MTVYVQSVRSPSRPFAPIVVWIAEGQTRAAARRQAEKVVRQVPRFRHFDYRGFTYNPRSGRAVFT